MLELCLMRNKIFKFFFILTLLLSFKINAELIFENDFPKNMHGIWSSDCVSEKQVFIFSGFRYEILKRKGNRITKIKIKKLA